MTEVEYIVKKAKSMGACNLLRDDANLNRLDTLMWHPQGQEFIHKHSFPSITTLRRLYSDGYNGIYTDRGDIRSKATKIAIAGDTTLTLLANELKRYDIVLFHGAKMVVEASNYSIVHVTRVGQCEILFKNLDGTSKMFE